MKKMCALIAGLLMLMWGGVAFGAIVADFEADKYVAGPPPVAIQFTDLSTGGATSWAWDFDGDDVIDSTLQNPSHIYTATGSYTVKLTASGPLGVSQKIKSSYITIRNFALPGDPGSLSHTISAYAPTRWALSENGLLVQTMNDKLNARTINGDLVFSQPSSSGEVASFQNEYYILHSISGAPDTVLIQKHDASGNLVWSSSSQALAQASLSIGVSGIYINGKDSQETYHVVAYTHDGQFSWDRSFIERVTVAIGPGGVIMVSTPDALTALRADGSILWELAHEASDFAFGRYIYAYQRDYSQKVPLRAYDYNGNLVWTASYPGNKPFIANNAWAYKDTLLALFSSTKEICQIDPATGQAAVAVNPNDLSISYRLLMGSTGYLYAVGSASSSYITLKAFNASTLPYTLVWNHDILAKLSDPLIHDGFLLLSNIDRDATNAFNIEAPAIAPGEWYATDGNFQRNRYYAGDLPAVAIISPRHYASDVSPDAVVTARFTRDMDEASLTASGVFTLETAARANVSGQVTYDAATRTVTFTPDAPLAEGETYLARITTQAKDTTGEPLAFDYTWRFTVAGVSGNTLAATRGHANVYSDGDTFEVTMRVDYTGALTALGVTEQIPAGWSFVSVGGDDPPGVTPTAGATGELEFAWVTPPASPASFTYTLNVPTGTTGEQFFTGEALYRRDAGELGAAIPATSADLASFHSADYNPADWAINLSELLRLIQFYNSNGYHCAAGGEDGYAPGAGDETCAHHDSDYNPADWATNLSELLRLIQFYNTGAYHTASGTEDGFAPGAAPDAAPDSGAPTASMGVAGAGASRTLTLEISGADAVTALGARVELPAGWSLASVSGSAMADVAPAAGETGTLEFAWIERPGASLTLTLECALEPNASGNPWATVLYRESGAEMTLDARSAPLAVTGAGCLIGALK